MKKNISLNLAVLKNLSNVQNSQVKGGASGSCVEDQNARATSACI